MRASGREIAYVFYAGAARLRDVPARTAKNQFLAAAALQDVEILFRLVFEKLLIVLRKPSSVAEIVQCVTLTGVTANALERQCRHHAPTSEFWITLYRILTHHLFFPISASRTALRSISSRRSRSSFIQVVYPAGNETDPLPSRRVPTLVAEPGDRVGASCFF